MDDGQIVALYWARDERALTESAAKYGAYCRAIAGRIVRSPEDAEECVNDTWTGAWNSIPPHRPERLSTYLGKLTRRISLNRLRAQSAEKRGGGEVPLALDELNEAVPDRGSVEEHLEAETLAGLIDAFLERLPTRERRVFVLRYYHLLPIRAICEQLGFSKSRTESMLFRTRKKL